MECGLLVESRNHQTFLILKVVKMFNKLCTCNDRKGKTLPEICSQCISEPLDLLLPIR